MENNKVIHYTSFEWGIINLFDRIYNKFIMPKMDFWKNRMIEDNKVRFNLLSGFLNIYFILNEEISFEQENKNGINQIFIKNDIDINDLHSDYLIGNIKINNQKIILILNELISSYGFLLFNSYLFNIVVSNGEKSLKPNILGYKFNRNNKSELERSFQYFNQNKFTYRLYNFYQFALSNSNQTLPFKGGVSPHYVFLNTLPGYIEEIAHLDNNFLENFSMLFKREDYLQGHLSSLIHTLRPSLFFSDNDTPIGAIMLSSIIPNAYNDEDQTNLHNIIIDFNEKGYISDNLVDAVHDYDSIWTEINFTNNELKFDEDLEKKTDKNLKEFILNNDSLFYFKGIVSDLDSKHELKNICEPIAVDFEKLQSMARNIFPSGPWLERSLICNTDGFNDKKRDIPIDLNSLVEYNNMLMHLFNKSAKKTQSTLNEFRFFKQFIDVLLPEISHSYNDLTDCIQNIKINDDFSLCIIAKPHSLNPKDLDSINSLKERLLTSILSDCNLPDGENNVFLEVESKWSFIQNNKRLKKTSQNEFNQSDSEDLFNEIETLLSKQKEIRAIFLLKNRKLFIPEINPEIGSRKLFIERFTDFASYWLFEKLNHHFYDNSLNSDSFNLGDFSSSIMHYYIYDEETNKNLITAHLSNNKEKNIKFIKTLVFYGIQVNNWDSIQPKSIEINELPYIAIHFKDEVKSYTSFNEFYKAYINLRFENAGSLECIKRIFDETIDKIRIEKNNDILYYLISFSEGLSSTQYNIKWSEVDSFMPELVILNYESVFNSNNKQISNFKNQWPNEEFILEYDFCKSYSGLNCLKYRNRDFQKKENIDQVFNDIKNTISRIGALKNEEKATLLPQLSHAIGTEIGALANALRLYIQVLALSDKTSETNLKSLFLEIRENKINISELNLFPEIAEDYNKLTNSQKDFLRLLIDHFPQFDLKSLNQLIDVCKSYSNTHTFSDFLKNFALDLKSLRDKNRALLRIDEKESQIQFSKEGTYNLESLYYSGLLFAISHFFGNTIFRERDDWAMVRPKFSEDTYRLAFNNYWGSENYTYFEEEKNIWNKYLLFNRIENSKEQFYYWYNEYKESKTAIFIFKSEIPQNIKFNGATGALIIDVMFQEIILNALKYSRKQEGKVVLEISIHEKNNEINDFEFKSLSGNATKRTEGKGKSFINKVLNNVLNLKPHSQNISYSNLDHSGYYIIKAIKK